jgi:hypothetical protein
MKRLCEYNHIQKGITRPILLISAIIFLVMAYVIRETPPLMPVLLSSALVCVLLAFAFGTLTVKDEEDRLAVRFGPLQVFKKYIPYTEITDLEQTRSTFLAGWGIHWTLRGWLWNIGGFDCVWIETGRTSILVGTDDPEGLVTFLQRRIDRRSNLSDEDEV